MTRRLGLAAVLLALAGTAAGAECGAQRDFLVRGDPVLAPVRPADCARILPDLAALSWPAVGGAGGYVVTLTHPDGRVEDRAAASNTLDLGQALPAGTYTWQVKVAGSRRFVGEPRSFTVDG